MPTSMRSSSPFASGTNPSLRIRTGRANSVSNHHYLGNNTGNFDCVAFEVNEPTTQDDDVFSKWVMSSDYATIMNRTVYIANDTSIDFTQNSYSIGLRGLDNNTNKGFSFVSNSKGVYEVIASS